MLALTSRVMAVSDMLEERSYKLRRIKSE